MRAPMQRRLPLTIQPMKAAEKRLNYVGIYPKGFARRLADLVVSVDSDVKVAFCFAVDSRCLSVISLTAELKLSLMCQRCGKIFQYSLYIENKSSPVKNDKETEQLPAEYDPIELDNRGRINLLKLVEDEIILALPAFPMHETADCKVMEINWSFGEISEEVNGFSKLSDLKNN